MSDFFNIIYEDYKFYLLIFLLGLSFFIFFLIKNIFIKFWKIVFLLFIKAYKYFSKVILSNKKVKKFINKNPNIFNFLKYRFKKDYFFWLPLSILLLLILYILTEYIWFTDAVLDWDLITQIDVRLSEFFYYFKDIRFINLFLFISYFWNKIIVFLIIFLISIFLFLNWKKRENLWLLFSVFSASLISFISKIIIERPIPEYAVYVDIWYSFPSFHATISVALYGFLIFLILAKIKKYKRKINLVFFWIFIAFFIWLSRLYLNTAYLSDVISGWYLWWLWLAFWVTFVWYLKHKKLIKDKLYFKVNNKILISILFLFFIIFFIFYYKIYYSNIVFNKDLVNNYTQIKNIENILDDNSHLKYTETITWRETEPINFIFIAKNDQELINIFKNAWWDEADKLWRTALKKIWSALIEKTEYDTAPITPLYWNKNIQDFWFQKLTGDENIKYRHHIRIWKTNYKLWKNYIYVWCWVYDDWLKWWITHKIDSDLDKEREYIFSSLEKTWFIVDSQLIYLQVRKIWTNFSWDEFYTDSNAYLIKLN